MSVRETRAAIEQANAIDSVSGVICFESAVLFGIAPYLFTYIQGGFDGIVQNPDLLWWGIAFFIIGIPAACWSRWVRRIVAVISTIAATAIVAIIAKFITGKIIFAIVFGAIALLFVGQANRVAMIWHTDMSVADAPQKDVAAVQQEAAPQEEEAL